jgi:hypothetical protein
VTGRRWHVLGNRWQVADGGAAAADMWCSSAILFLDQLVSRNEGQLAGGRWQEAGGM